MTDTTLEQPDWIETGTSIYDCGECGTPGLDIIVLYEGTDDEVVWLACPNCGFEGRDIGDPTVESEWYHSVYDE